MTNEKIAQADPRPLTNPASHPTRGDEIPPTGAYTKHWTPRQSLPKNSPGVFPEPPNEGIHAWTMSAAWWCKKSGMSIDDAIIKIQSFEPGLRRPFNPDEVTVAVAKVYSAERTSVPQQAATPKWPEVDLTAQQEAGRNSPYAGIAELSACSQTIPTELVADHVVDHLFLGDPLLCLGVSPYDFGVVQRSEVQGELAYTSLIVPSPMSAPVGSRKSDGELSVHTEDNTGPRKYLVCEFDGGLSNDCQASIIGRLSKFAPLVCVCFSGGKSLHSWFNVEAHPEAAILRFFRYAVSLGADPATWSRTQFCRLPGGYNHDKGAIQEVYFLNPGVMMAELPEPPTVGVGYPWDIQSGGDIWSDDPAIVVNLSDPPLIDNIMRKCEVGTVVGAAKTSKTWFALHLALCVATGTKFLDNQAHKANTLYLDYELKPKTFQKRMCMLASEKPHGFFYQCLRGCIQLPTIDQIAELIISRRIEFLVVDSLYRTGWLTEENNNDSTARQLSVLQQLATRTGCTILVVDHTAKGGGNERSAVDASRGASSKGGFFDFIFVLRATAKGPDPDLTYVALDPVLRDWPGLKSLPLISFKWEPLRCHVKLEGEVRPTIRISSRAGSSKS